MFWLNTRCAREEAEPQDRPLNFVPQRFAAMRHVPLYQAFIKERFERCLDLYLCPRAMKRKLNVRTSSNPTHTRHQHEPGPLTTTVKP